MALKKNVTWTEMYFDMKSQMTTFLYWFSFYIMHFIRLPSTWSWSTNFEFQVGEKATCAVRRSRMDYMECFFPSFKYYLLDLVPRDF